MFRSVGYRGVGLPGVPFDERQRHDPERARGASPKGVYVAGWIKRFPSGVIGTNKKDAAETVEVLPEDLRDAPRKGKTAADIDAFLLDRGIRFVLYSGWTAIDELERAAGEKLGRPRVKFVTWDELLRAAEKSSDQVAERPGRSPLHSET